MPSVQFSSVAQSCPTLYDPMNRGTPGLPVHHHLPEFTQTHIHWVGDVIQPSHPLSSPPPPAPNPSQHQSLFQWVNSLHEENALGTYNSLRFSPFECCDFMVHNLKKIQVIKIRIYYPSVYLLIYLSMFLSVSK